MDARRCLCSYTDYFLALLKNATATTKDHGDVMRGNVLSAFDLLVIYDSKTDGLVQP
jgi:hypothetical protein